MKNITHAGHECYIYQYEKHYIDNCLVKSLFEVSSDGGCQVGWKCVYMILKKRR